jgi:hypothetical protein
VPVSLPPTTTPAARRARVNRREGAFAGVPTGLSKRFGIRGFPTIKLCVSRDPTLVVAIAGH